MKKAFFIFLFSSLFTLTSCKNEINTPIKLQGFVFGTSYNIIYYDVGISFEEEIIQLFEDINNSISTYIPTSDISRINSGDSGVIVDAYFKEIFSKSERIFKETKGYFDPTVGNLVNAWGFGFEKNQNLDSLKIKKILKNIGFDKIYIKNDSLNTLRPRSLSKPWISSSIILEIYVIIS